MRHVSVKRLRLRDVAAGEGKARAAERKQESLCMWRYESAVPTMTPERAEGEVLRKHHPDVATYIKYQTLLHKNACFGHHLSQNIHPRPHVTLAVLINARHGLI